MKALLGAGAIRRFKMWQKKPVLCVAAPLFHLTYEQKPLEGATRGGCGKKKKQRENSGLRCRCYFLVAVGAL